jgi:hypothetical protein
MCIHHKEVNDYINQSLNNTSKDFALLSLIGLTQLGKSTLAKIITGVDHEVGRGIRAVTSGITLVHAGTIEQIFKRLNIDINDEKYNDIDMSLDIFVADVEGLIQSRQEVTNAKLIAPLISISSKVVLLSNVTPDDSVAEYIGNITKIMESISPNKTQDICQKLIIRVRDFPQIINYNLTMAKNIDDAIKSMEESYIHDIYEEKGMSPVIIPSGPFLYDRQSFIIEFMDYFLISVFTDIKNRTLRPDELAASIKEMEASMDESPEVFLRWMEKYTHTEKIVSDITFQERGIIIEFFNDKKIYECNEEKINQKREEILSRITKFCKNNNIDDESYMEKLSGVLKFFDDKKNLLKRNLERYNRLQFRANDILFAIKSSIEDTATMTFKEIFEKVNLRYVDIEYYERQLDASIQFYEDCCTNFIDRCIYNYGLRDFFQKHADIEKRIRDDVDEIFKVLKRYKTWSELHAGKFSSEEFQFTITWKTDIERIYEARGKEYLLFKGRIRDVSLTVRDYQEIFDSIEIDTTD